SCPASTKASRLGTANSGLPMKTIRMLMPMAETCPHGQAPYGIAAMASQQIEALSQALARLPGLGPRSARRAVLHLMKKRETALQPLLAALKNVSDKLSTCSVCGNVDTADPCTICK